MSKLYRFRQDLKGLESRGWIKIEGDVVTILSHQAEVKDWLMQTQWGALLLMGAMGVEGDNVE